MKKKPLVLDSTNCNFLRVVNDMIRPKSSRPRREVLSWNSKTKVTTRYWEDIEEDDE